MPVVKLTRQSRFLLWLLVAFFKRHRGHLLLLILVFLVFAFILGKIIDNHQPAYNEGVVGNYTITQIPPRVIRLVSEGLVTFDKSGYFQPGLAEKWQIEDGGRKFTFQLKSGLKWQDGSDLKSSDIAIVLEGVKIEYPDSKTIVFTIKEPFAPFPSVLTRPVFKKETLIGTGFYKIDKIVKNNEVVDKVELRSLKTGLPDVNFRFYPNDRLAVMALKIGQVQAISNITNAADLDKWQNMTLIKKSDSQKYVAVFFNTQSPNLQDKAVRVAINQAINRHNFSQQLAIGPISPNSWSYNDGLKRFSYDPDKSKKTIDEKSKEALNLKMLTTPVYEDLAKQLIDDWSQINVKVQLQVTSNPLNGSNYDLLLSAQDIPYDPDQYTLWHSTQKKTNKTKLSDPKIDKLLEDGRKTTDQEVRRQKYLDFQRFLVENSPAAFLYYPNQYFIYYRNNFKSLDNLDRQYPGFKIE